MSLKYPSKAHCGFIFATCLLGDTFLVSQTIADYKNNAAGLRFTDFFTTIVRYLHYNPGQRYSGSSSCVLLLTVS